MPINSITVFYFRYEERLGSLQSKVKELEVTASKQAQSERADDARLRELVHGLKVENADLLSKVKNLELEHEDKNDRITMLKVQLGTYYQILSMTIFDILNIQSADENFYISLIMNFRIVNEYWMRKKYYGPGPWRKKSTFRSTMWETYDDSV